MIVKKFFITTARQYITAAYLQYGGSNVYALQTRWPARFIACSTKNMHDHTITDREESSITDVLQQTTAEFL